MTIIWVVLAILVAALVISGKARTLVSGFWGSIVEDVAKTPEGANAIYTEAIDKAQDAYNKASNYLQKVAGQLDTANINCENGKNKLKSIEKKCEQLAQSGRFDDIKVYADERTLVLEEVESYTKAVEKLTPMCEEAKQVKSFYEQKLNQLKKEKNTTVNGLKLNKQIKEMYDDMDELKKTSDIDKLLQSVKEGSDETREGAVGARIVHESKNSTKISKLDAELKSAQNDEYIQNLKNKYKK